MKAARAAQRGTTLAEECDNWSAFLPDSLTAFQRRVRVGRAMWTAATPGSFLRIL